MVSAYLYSRSPFTIGIFLHVLPCCDVKRGLKILPTIQYGTVIRLNPHFEFLYPQYCQHKLRIKTYWNTRNPTSYTYHFDSLYLRHFLRFWNTVGQCLHWLLNQLSFVRHLSLFPNHTQLVNRIMQEIDEYNTKLQVWEVLQPQYNTQVWFVHCIQRTSIRLCSLPFLFSKVCRNPNTML